MQDPPEPSVRVSPGQEDYHEPKVINIGRDLQRASSPQRNECLWVPEVGIPQGAWSSWLLSKFDSVFASPMPLKIPKLKFFGHLLAHHSKPCTLEVSVNPFHPFLSFCLTLLPKQEARPDWQTPESLAEMKFLDSKFRVSDPFPRLFHLPGCTELPVYLTSLPLPGW